MSVGFAITLLFIKKAAVSDRRFNENQVFLKTSEAKLNSAAWA
jgi:hypothetical protein